MKVLLYLFILIFLASAGCAPGYVTTTKTQGDRELESLYRDNPDILRIWAEGVGN